jgi:hypothetical protein
MSTAHTPGQEQSENWLLSPATSILTLPMALSANGDDQCRNMNGHGVISEYQEPCDTHGRYSVKILV